MSDVYSMQRLSYVFMLIFSFLASNRIPAKSWPVYKGNFYFTGNNDEIIVKNKRIRWIFQADKKVDNPIVSDGFLYFTDRNKNLYCVSELSGSLIWKYNLKLLSRKFDPSRRAPGKIRYPLIKGDSLFITDSSLIYSINKKTGRVQWARAGSVRAGGKFARRKYAHIYSTPLIVKDAIVYGSRKKFMARNIYNGRLLWVHNNIQSFSAFPTVYENTVYTQSMNYLKGVYTIYALNSVNGQVLWKQNLPKPFKIFSPVVYQDNLLIPVNDTLYALDKNDGIIKFTKKYENLITSAPSFTDNEILLTIGNKDLFILDAKTGRIKSKKLTTTYPNSPYFVTIRDHFYLSHIVYRNRERKKTTYTKLIHGEFLGERPIWEFESALPGSPSQPVASKGVLFLPVGKYVIALGKPPKTKKTGDDYLSFLKNGKMPGTDESETKITALIVNNKKPETTSIVSKIPLRKIKVQLVGKDKPGKITVVAKKRFRGETVFRKRYEVKDGATFEIPDDDDIEIVASATNYIPLKKYVTKKDSSIPLDFKKAEKGASIDMQSIYFESGKAYLKEESLDILDQLVKLLKVKKELNLVVIGHTDSKGSPRYNMGLSIRRANSVKAYLCKSGVALSRVIAKGMGEKKPVASNKTPIGRKKNRRTEFVFN